MGLSRLTLPATIGLLLLGAALLCGLRLPAEGDRTLAFEAFGFVEGVLALLVLFLFLRQGVLPMPGDWSERLVLAYWFGATAVLLRLGLPPPGLGYWIGTAIFAAALLGAFGGDDRRRTLFTVGVALAICGMLRFALIPFVWRHATLPEIGPIDLRGLSDWAKGLVTDYQPVRPGNEVLNVAGIALYALAIWRSWPDLERDPLAGLDAEERDRLLRVLLRSDREVPAAGAARLEAVHPEMTGPPRPGRALAAPSGEQEADAVGLAGDPDSPSRPGAPVHEPLRPRPGPEEPPSAPHRPPAERREPPPDPQNPPPQSEDPPSDPDAPLPGPLGAGA